MPNRHILILLLLFIISPIPAICDDAPLQPPPEATTFRQEQAKSNQTTFKSQPTNQPSSYADVDAADLSTPKKSTSSFIGLFNNIMPPTQVPYLQAICTKFAIPSYHNSCLEVLGSRLRYLKSINHNLKGAMFTRQPLTQVSKTPIAVKVTWQENLSFIDGPIKSNTEDMTLTLQESSNEWKIIKIEWTHHDFAPK